MQPILAYQFVLLLKLGQQVVFDNFLITRRFKMGKHRKSDIFETIPLSTLYLLDEPSIIGVGYQAQILVSRLVPICSCWNLLI
ncbi:DNA-directed RNA polymerase subunit beta C-terminal section [Dirofilaria immitis]